MKRRKSPNFKITRDYKQFEKSLNSPSARVTGGRPLVITTPHGYTLTQEDIQTCIRLCEVNGIKNPTRNGILAAYMSFMV